MVEALMRAAPGDFYPPAPVLGGGVNFSVGPLRN